MILITLTSPKNDDLPVVRSSSLAGDPAQDAGFILDQLEAEDGCRIVSEVNGCLEAFTLKTHEKI